MSLVGCVLNQYPSTYDGRFFVASYDSLPKSWDKIGTLGTEYRTLHNDGTPYPFGDSKYLVVVVMPTNTDMFGSAIAFNVPMLMGYAASTTDSIYKSNLILHFCTQSNGTFTYNFTDSHGEHTHTIPTGATSGVQDMYVALNSYSVTDAVSSVFPYIIGTSSGSSVFAQADTTGALQIITPVNNVVVSLKKTHGFLYIFLIILVIMMFGLVIVLGWLRYKHKI